MLHAPNVAQYAPAPETLTPAITRRVSHTVVDGERFVAVHVEPRRWVGYFPGVESIEDISGKTRKELLREARAELQFRKGGSH